MNSRQHRRHQELRSLVGYKILDACSDCIAYLVITDLGGGRYRGVVFHADCCPVLAGAVTWRPA